MATKVAGLYDMEDTLGSGHFAVVKSARHVFTGLRVAIKVIDKNKLDEVSRQHLYQEVRCMKLVTHPSIIRLYEVIDTQSKLYLIQELGDGGDLYDFIMKHPSGIEENSARKIFRQTVSAIQYCHKLHVVHRDLKPENLVFCSGQNGPQIKLTDFGLSRTFLPGEMIESSCGSLEYSAPEILLGESYDPPKIDVWSLGVILFMLITGRSPFAYGGAGETLTRIMDGKYLLPTTVSESCRSLIGSMIVVDASKRVSLDDVAHNDWLQQGIHDDPLDHAPMDPAGSLELPESEIELILDRMADGGYGEATEILRLIKEKPYGSTAATFYLLVEAERHRQLHAPATPTRSRKISMPMGPRPITLPINSHLTATPQRHGSAESGVLQPRRTPNTTTEELRRFSDDVSMSTPNKLRQPLAPRPPNTPVNSVLGAQHTGVYNSPTPAFPIKMQQEETQEQATTPTAIPTLLTSTPAVLMENIDHNKYLYGNRQLSTFEEESETESIPDSRMQRNLSVSPVHSSPGHSGIPRTRSRQLTNSRSSPHLIGSVSKSDVSDDEQEDDDDIVELMTTSGRFPSSKGATFPRLSPSHSPLLTSRRSPTHYLTGSSDDEVASAFETARKNRSKRLPYRKTSRKKLARVDSMSSDDGAGSESKEVKARMSRKAKLLALRQHKSLPAASNDSLTSDSLTDLLENIRRQRSSSVRSNSSLSDGIPAAGDRDMNELAQSLVSEFKLSDDDLGGGSVEVAMETDRGLPNGGDCNVSRDSSPGVGGKRTGGNTTTLRTVFCSIL